MSSIPINAVIREEANKSRHDYHLVCLRVHCQVFEDRSESNGFPIAPWLRRGIPFTGVRGMPHELEVGDIKGPYPVLKIYTRAAIPDGACRQQVEDRVLRRHGVSLAEKDRQGIGLSSSSWC